MPLGPLLLFGNDQASNPGASVVTLYCNDPISSGGSAGTLTSTVPAASTSTTGWTVGTIAPTAYSRQTYNSEVGSTNFTATTQPADIPEAFGADCWRYGPISGQFSLGTWYSSLSVIGVTSGGDQDGRARFRIWRSHFASGSTTSQIASDDFNGANENPIDRNGAWATGSGDVGMQLASNAASNSFAADSTSYYKGNPAPTWPNDQYSQAKLTVVGINGSGAGVCLIVRQSATARTHYRLAMDHAAANNIVIGKHVAGVGTTLLTTTLAWSDGDTWEFWARGPLLSALRNGTLVAAVTDTAIASGFPGMGISTTITSCSVDDWTAGTFGGTTEVTNGTMVGTTVTNLSTTVAQSSAASQQIAAFPVSNEYLFLQAAWEITGAGAATDRDVLVRYGSMSATDGSGLVMGAFAATGAVATVGAGLYEWYYQNIVQDEV